MKTALVYDSGLFPYVASKLAEGYDRVLYFTPYSADAFPVSRKRLWGVGVPGVTRVDDFFDHVDEADIIVFPDHGAGDLQAYLLEQGKAVWGSGLSETLELDRVRFRRLQRSLRIPAPKTHVLVGTEALRRHLEDPRNENQYVKLGEYRGDMESHHHENWWLSEPWWKDLDHRLGPMRDSLEFLSEHAIDDAVEVGFDGLFLGGRFCSPCMMGYEVKDIAYVGRVYALEDMPKVVLEPAVKLSETLSEMRCRSFVSLEMRVTEDGISYLIDPCLRAPSPVTEGSLEVFGNWTDIFTEGAKGQTPKPAPKHEFCAELVLRSDFASDDFLAIQIPDEYRHLVKLHGHAIVDGVDYVVAVGMDILGAAVGVGETLDEACEQATEVAKSLKAYQLEFQEDGFDVARERIAAGNERGLIWD